MSEQRILSEWLCVPLLGDLFARFVDLLFYCTVYCFCECSGVKVPDKQSPVLSESQASLTIVVLCLPTLNSKSLAK